MNTNCKLAVLLLICFFHLTLPCSLLLEIVLRPYQLEGIQWMIGRYKTGLGCILADEMGLGKTCQVVHISKLFLHFVIVLWLLLIVLISSNRLTANRLFFVITCIYLFGLLLSGFARTSHILCNRSASLLTVMRHIWLEKHCAHV